LKRRRKKSIGAYHSAVPTPVIDPRLSTGWVSPERLQASPLRRTARSLLTSACRAGPPILRCWIKIGGPARALQTRSVIILTQEAAAQASILRGPDRRPILFSDELPGGAGGARLPSFAFTTAFCKRSSWNGQRPARLAPLGLSFVAGARSLTGCPLGPAL
jgi:hypothetical protein